MKISLKESLIIITFLVLLGFLTLVENQFQHTRNTVKHIFGQNWLQLITLGLFLGLLYWMMKKKKVKEE